MAIEKTEIEARDGQEGGEETAAQRESREREEQQAALEAEREARHKAELDAAAARGETEALRRGVGSQPPPPAPSAVTEEQWVAMERETGMSRDMIQGNSRLFGSLFASVAKPLQEEARAAREEAAAAREEARRVRAGQSIYAIEQEFYSKNPALVGRKADIAEFMAMVPEEVKSDPKKYGEALEKAKVFARGKAREDVSLRRGRGTERRELPNPNPDGGEEGRTGEEPPELDVSDLDNEGAASLISRLHRNPGPEHLSADIKALDELTIAEAFKQSERKDGRGVSIDERGEWYRGQSQAERALRETRVLGGRRGGA